MKKVTLFGGTGFIGSYLLKCLVEHGYHVFLPIRNKHIHVIPIHENITPIAIHTFSDEMIDRCIASCETIIYNIGIIREFPSKGITFKYLHQELPEQIIRIAGKNNVKQFLYMSANDVDNQQTKYQKTKLKTERFLQNSNLEWTIFRPSVVFGNPHEHLDFVTQLYNTMIKPPFPVPLFYNYLPTKAGAFQMSPIHVQDVVNIIIQSIDDTEMFNKVIPLGGIEKLSWSQIIAIISGVVKKSKLKIPVPILPIKIVTHFLERFPWYPVTADQLTMLVAGNTCDSHHIFTHFGMVPIPFSTENLSYLIPKPKKYSS